MLTLSRFKGAYCSVWETEPLTDIFGEMDVLVRTSVSSRATPKADVSRKSDTLPEMADKIIAASR